MTKSIPANFFMKVDPEVIDAGGSALVLNGLMLTTSTRAPLGTVGVFPSQLTVAGYFGASSPEAASATTYFNGFEGSNVKPGSFLIAQYPPAPVAAWLAGGTLSGMSLAALQALSGTLILTVDGTLHTSAAINLSAATSFSNAATLILAGFTLPGFTIAFDSVSSAFVLTSATTGAASTISFATGTLASALGLIQVDGAVMSQGAVAATPGSFMDAITLQTQNWATFFTQFDPDGGDGNAVKLEFAAWTSGQNKRWAYIAWDTDLSPTVSADAVDSLGQLILAAGYDGTCCIYDTTCSTAAFISGTAASIDFTENQGSTNFAYRTQDGLPGVVGDELVATNLIANGYNFYGIVAAANQGFVFFFPGSISGRFKSLRAYINQIWMNAALQLAGIELQTSVKNLAYTQKGGYALMRQAFMDPINDALTFGAIQAGVPLNSLQAAEINAAAGVAIDGIVGTVGFYLQILPATAQVRQAGGSPPTTLWYTDGGSILYINLVSADIL